jgi:hypothetical protein
MGVVLAPTLPNMSGSGRARAMAGVIMLPLFLFAFGCYCIYTSIRNGTILTLKTLDGKRDFVSLREIEKEGKLMDLQKFLKSQRGS